jgi:hypothetical protein
MRYGHRFSPRVAASALGDLLAYWRQPTPYRWQILGVSVGLTFTLMVLFIPESQRVEPRPPDVTLISTFEAGRSDAEIMASNIENQKRQDELQARREAAAERKREAYKALGRASGFDVEAMERQIERERAAEAAAAAAAARRSRTASADDN